MGRGRGKSLWEAEHGLGLGVAVRGGAGSVESERFADESALGAVAAERLRAELEGDPEALAEIQRQALALASKATAERKARSVSALVAEITADLRELGLADAGEVGELESAAAQLHAKVVNERREAAEDFRAAIATHLRPVRRRSTCHGRHRRASGSRPSRRRGSSRCSSGTRAGPDDPGGDEPPGDLVALSRNRRGPHREARP